MPLQVTRPNLCIRDIAQQILLTRKITRADQSYFMQLTSSVNDLDEEDRTFVNQLFDALQDGRVRVVD
ncbi:hypothetical protein [Vacuolonema iberomarrocanum]|uniref:hypothetical protein n=1 Tax=Vacuolonema iberomarrocanum TaxID=3454632 RepID=UPI001A051A60|nr:hypothetical protein [filamentous cyanobacterium LEGE 07170]